MGRLAALLLLVALLCPASVAAQRLPRTVVPEHYDLAITVDLVHASFEGTEHIRVHVGAPTTQIVLNAAGLTIQAASLGRGPSAQAADVALDAVAETATFTVPRPVSGSTDIDLHYSARLNDDLRGFYISQGELRTYAVTQFESTDARRAFPCFDEPEYKATFALRLTIARRDVAISNGRVVSDTPGPGPDQHTVVFSTSPRMSSYLVAMAVGDFQCLEAVTDGIPLRVCAAPDKKNLGHFALESAQAILHFYNRYYAVPYPFGKLDMLAVPDFAAGAMENTAAIFFRETDLLTDAATASVATRKSIASVLAHEIAHQWFGNLVTMRWWDDLWLNEGFATWMANLPLHAWKPEWNIPVDEAIENQRALALDSLGTTRAIRSPVETPTEIDAAFDGIVYEKGAAVLRMIEQYVGRDTFRRGINAYLRAHAYGTATSEDFWKTIARTSGKPVDAVLATFITQPGAPVLDVTALACGGTPARARARVAQGRFRVGPGTDLAGNQPTWRIPVCLRTAGAPVCSLVSSPRQWVSGGRRCSSWVFANAGGRGYYRTAYAPRLVRALAPHVAALTAAERLTLIDDEWALVRAGRHDAAAYLTLAAAYGREPSSGVVAELVDHLAFVREHLTTATTRAQFERFVRGLLRPTFDALGFANRPADTDDRRTLRAVVIAALGTTGDDLDIVRESRAALDRALTGGPPLDATLAASIVRVAVEHGDRPLYDAVEAASTLAASPDDRHTYFYAAAQFRDPAIVDRALARALASNVRTQDTALYLSEFFANPAARPRAWAFVKANWTALAPKLAIFGADTTLAGAVGALCDGETRDDVRQFFAAHPLPGARHSIDLALERVESCVRMTREQTAVVEAWLAARARPGQATAEQDGRPRRVPGSARRGTGPTAAERRAVRP